MSEENEQAEQPHQAAAPASSRWFKSLSTKAAFEYLSTAGKRTAETVKPGIKTASEGLAAGGKYVWNATGQVVGRFTPQGLLVQCQKEAKEVPCPRIMLICCTALCSGALASEGLFTTNGPADMVETLFHEIEGARAAKLLPPGTTPQVIASVVKHWLCTLHEPLMTFKLVPALTSTSTPTAALKAVLAELPLVNAATLHLLLDTCNRIVSNAAINDTDANALAAALAPCLLWKAPTPAAVTDADAPVSPASPIAPGNPLTEDELNVFKPLLAHLISSYRSFC